MSDAHEHPEPRDLPRARPAADLGARPRTHFIAIALWASFLGAIPMLLTWLVLLPDDASAALGIEEVSFGFFLCWIAALLPAVLALLLSARTAARHAPAPIEHDHEQAG